MKICFIEQRYMNRQTTGPTRHIRDLATSLASSGHEILVICEATSGISRASSTSHLLAGNRVRVLELDGCGIGNLRILRGLAKHIKRERPDVVHTQGYRNLVTDAAAFACLLNEIPLVLTPRGSLLGYRYRQVESPISVEANLYDIGTLKMTLRMADAIVVASTIERDDALSLGIRPERIKMIPHGMVFPDIPRDEAPIEGDPRILTVSRITPHRNILEIVQSMQYILQSYPDAFLYVAGDPIASTKDLAEKMYPCRVREAAANPALKGRVRLLGGVYGDALWKLFAASDLFVYASSYDNFGFGLLEAASFGLPIVSTDAGIASKLIAGERGGEILRSFDEHEIAEACVRILRNPRRMIEMRNHLMETAHGYSIEKNRDAHIDLYKTLLNERRSQKD